MPEPTLAQMIKKRWQLHDKIEAITAQAKAEVKPFADALGKVEAMIEAHCKTHEIVSEETEYGGVQRANQKWANVQDFDTFLDWVLAQPKPKEVISVFVKHALKSTELHKYHTETNEVPPGVDLGGKFYYQHKR